MAQLFDSLLKKALEKLGVSQQENAEKMDTGDSEKEDDSKPDPLASELQIQNDNAQERDKNAAEPRNSEEGDKENRAPRENIQENSEAKEKPKGRRHPSSGTPAIVVKRRTDPGGGE